MLIGPLAVNVAIEWLTSSPRLSFYVTSMHACKAMYLLLICALVHQIDLTPMTGLPTANTVPVNVKDKTAGVTSVMSETILARLPELVTGMKLGKRLYIVLSTGSTLSTASVPCVALPFALVLVVAFSAAKSDLAVTSVTGRA